MRTLLRAAITSGIILSAIFITERVDAQPASSDLMLILDASGSMWGQVEGKNKIVIAREVLKDMLADLPTASEIGLVAYGHRREGDCADIELLTPMGPVDQQELSTLVDEINPKGKTPITAAVNETFAALAGREGPTTVVLLSDGIETCGGDPCQAVRDARAAGIDFIMHIVGFDVAAEDVSQLECAAQAGGGMYFDAANAEELALAMERAVDVPVDSSEAVLAVTGTALGALVDVSVNIVDAETGKWVAGGRTYADPATNPRHIPLPAGRFDVEIQAVGMRGRAERHLTGLELARGDTAHEVIDFSPGDLVVGITRNGELSDATVRVLHTGTTEQAAANRTYSDAATNPRKMTLVSGVFDVEIKAIEIEGAPSHHFENITVPPGGTVELNHNFESGEVWIGTVNAGELVDATVTLKNRDTGQTQGASRTYTAASSNPARFIVPPGTYEVAVKAVRLEGAVDRTVTVTVGTGGVVRETVDFGR